MGKPSSRITDQHICPMLDGPKPHVGGAIMPPGTPTVLIGGLPAATVGDMCLCVSPIPNAIATGSPGVWISGRPAARMFDKTLHGGTLLTGQPSVLIGDMSAVAGPAIFPGIQKYSNCGLQVSQQLIRQIKGDVLDEDAWLKEAIGAGLAHDGTTPDKPGVISKDLLGRTSAESLQQLLAGKELNSHIIHRPTVADLTTAISKGQGIIAGVDLGQFQRGNVGGGGHAVLIYDGDFNGQGELTHVYVNDTSGPEPDLRQGRRVPIVDMMQALDKFKDPKLKKPLAFLVVTEPPMWISTPIDLDPARPSGSA